MGSGTLSLKGSRRSRSSHQRGACPFNKLAARNRVFGLAHGTINLAIIEHPPEAGASGAGVPARVRPPGRTLRLLLALQPAQPHLNPRSILQRVRKLLRILPAV